MSTSGSSHTVHWRRSFCLSVCRSNSFHPLTFHVSTQQNSSTLHFHPSHCLSRQPRCCLQADSVQHITWVTQSRSKQIICCLFLRPLSQLQKFLIWNLRFPQQWMFIFRHVNKETVKSDSQFYHVCLTICLPAWISYISKGHIWVKPDTVKAAICNTFRTKCLLVIVIFWIL